MSIDVSTGVSVGSILLALLNFVYTRFKSEADLDKRIAVVEGRKDYSDKIEQLCEDMREVKVKNELIWGAVEKAMVDLLHHPTEIVRDSLLEKLRDKTITLKEMEELEKLLQEAIENKKGQTEAIAATLLLAVIQQKIYDHTHKIEILKGCLTS
jgi:phosphoenolpyruvate carboxylase